MKPSINWRKASRLLRAAVPSAAPAKRGRWIGGLSLAAAGAAVALLVGLTSVIDWVGRTIDPPNQPVVDAQLLNVALSREREPLGNYLRDTRQPLDELSEREQREQGLVFNVRVSIVGAVGKQFPLAWTMLDAKTGRPLSDDRLYRQIAVDFIPKGVTHNRTWQVWVPYPSRAGDYKLETTLMDENEQLVDQKTTEPFHVRSIPALE